MAYTFLPTNHARRLSAPMTSTPYLDSIRLHAPRNLYSSAFALIAHMVASSQGGKGVRSIRQDYHHPLDYNNSTNQLMTFYMVFLCLRMIMMVCRIRPLNSNYDLGFLRPTLQTMGHVLSKLSQRAASIVQIHILIFIKMIQL